MRTLKGTIITGILANHFCDLLLFHLVKFVECLFEFCVEELFHWFCHFFSPWYLSTGPGWRKWVAQVFSREFAACSPLAHSSCWTLLFFFNSFLPALIFLDRLWQDWITARVKQRQARRSNDFFLTKSISLLLLRQAFHNVYVPRKSIWKCFISIEGALRIPMTYDNHPIPSNPIPSIPIYSIEDNLS